MTRARLAAVLAAGVLFVLPSAGAAGAAGGAKPKPTVSVIPGTAKPGDRVIVGLNGWGVGTVVVGVCGNNARRGSDDCALVGDVGVAVRDRTMPTLVNLTVAAPPVPCPCVVRASTPATDVVRSAPIQLIGVPTGPELVPTGGAPPATQLRVAARVADGDASWPSSWLIPFAGSAPRELVLTVRNRGADPVTDVRVVGTVGRDRGHGEPLGTVRIRRIEGHATRTVRIPFDLSFPAFGDYTVAGSVYGLAAPARFDATTSNDPWGLELLVPVLLVVIAHLLRRRERARVDAEAEAEAEAEAQAEPTVGVPVEMLPESSPVVGGAVGVRSPGPAYDSPRSGHSEVGVNGDSREHRPAPVR